ncbi:hypothetical protein BH11VER1_BH11VER1_01980 [soil metagenome]
MTSTFGAKFIKVLMGLFLAVAGSIFVWVLWHSYQRAEETRHWTPVDAVIISSVLITDRPTPHSPLYYKADLKYRYTLEGKTWEGTHIQRVEGPSSSRDKADERVKKYPAGKVVPCYVNPAQREMAVLEHSTRAALYSLWFPLLFVVGGLGMIWGALRRKA